ncbi:MAG: hypothetical protein K8R54_15975 [Bacteroidales bacterium]|nr:hypothetical protein [Bacteroidales bacterium]
MKLLNLYNSENQNYESNEILFSNQYLLKKDELKQIKGGTIGGEEDDDDVDEIMEWE